MKWTQMVENNTLIVYQTKSGATKENAELIASLLRNNFALEVDIINLKENKKPDLTKYKNIVVGSGIRIGRWYGSAKSFLNKSDFSGKKLAIFLSSGRAGDPAENHDEVVQKYVGKMLRKRPSLKPVTYDAFGGYYKRGSEILEDFRDPEKVKLWTEKLGNFLTE